MKTITRKVKKNTLAALFITLISPLIVFAEVHEDSITETSSVQKKSGTIVGLYARMVEEKAFLIWFTDGATIDGFFVVERSKDGKFYEIIGFKDCPRSKLDTRLRYSFVDAEPGIGYVYYRLTQFDPVNDLIIAVETIVLTPFERPNQTKKDQREPELSKLVPSS